MWKRLPHYNRQREPAIGNPIFIDSTLDERTLDEIPNIGDLNNGQFTRYSLSATPAFGRRNSEDVVKGLPPLPFESLESPTNQYYRPVSENPTSSSVYSQPSPDLHHWYPKSPETNTDISPPSSPDTNAQRRSQEWQGSPNVSPVEELPEIPEEEPKQRSASTTKITVLRGSSKRGNSFTNAAGNFFSGRRGKAMNADTSDRDLAETRWDDYSGEPTTSTSGKPAQFKARSPLYNPTYSLGSKKSRLGNQEPVKTEKQKLAGQSFLERISPSQATSSPNAQEPWRGAIEGSPTPTLVLEKPLPATKPLIIPRRSSKRISVTMSSLSENDSPQLTPQPTQSNTRLEPFDAERVAVDDDGASVKPPVPLKAGRNSPPRDLASPTSQLASRPAYPSPASSESRTPASYFAKSDWFKNKPLPTPTETTPTSARDKTSPGVIETNFRTAMKNMQFGEQPISRFSDTTYATGTTYDSPPDSPSMSSAITPTNSTPTPPSSILNRRRPIPGTVGANARATARKPTPAHVGASANISPSSRRHSKTLPQSPPEIQSQDLISTLQAQLDDLHHRRGNLQRLLRDLTQLNVSSYDSPSRGEVKKKVIVYESEMAEIMREEHDVGLRLHRAWKRRDQQDSVEPTGLWVRRVTR
ncbi:MAG: hypothetical protein M1827_002821 [Pycnora praestabilis]|nr:MAG: hypothetical protein M1827_002821 [Pycnora praestabilis]